jgi:hypothetical protein
MIAMFVPTESVGTTQDNFSVTLGNYNSALTVTSTTSFKKARSADATITCVFADADAVNVAVTNTAPAFRVVVPKPISTSAGILANITPNTTSGAAVLALSLTVSFMFSVLF